MRETFLPFSPPSIGEDEISEVVNVLRSQWITTGPRTKTFEISFASAVGARGALALNSCTAALHLALAASGVGPGDEVITTPMTFAASVNVIEHVGARPVLVDVEPDTLNIDPARVVAAITPRTKAILPVHFTGHPVDLDPIQEAASPRDIMVLEDAAHAFPAKYKGRAIGSGPGPAAFSFYATKNLTTAEGGTLTGDPEFLDRARVLSLHGMSRDAWKRYERGGSWKYDIVAPGFKYNMTDIAAGMGLVQLDRIGEFQARRRKIVQTYQAAFEKEPGLVVPVERRDVEHAWHLYVLQLDLERWSIDRDRFIEEMRERNIATSVHFIPIHMHSYYREKYKLSPSDFPIASDHSDRMVSVPLHPMLTDNDVEDVIAAVHDVVSQYAR